MSRRACYVTFYITMSQLVVTIVVVMSQHQSNDSCHIAWEGHDCCHGVAAMTTLMPIQGTCCFASIAKDQLAHSQLASYLKIDKVILFTL